MKVKLLIYLFKIFNESIRSLYLFVFYIFKYTCKLFGIRVWTRNSILNNSFRAFKSDLDISAYFKNTRDENMFLYIYKMYKNLFPWLGEVNAYDTKKIELIKNGDFNILLLERDPQLIEILNLSRSNCSTYDATTFLIRAVQSDYHNLQQNPLRRILKWENHIIAVNKKLDAHFLMIGKADILSQILNIVLNISQTEKQYEKYQLAMALEMFKNNHLIEHTREYLSNEKVVWKYLPQEIYRNKNLNVPILDPSEVLYLISQVQWELLGLMTMAFGTQARKNCLQDILCLQNFLIGIVSKNQYSDIVRILKMSYEVETILRSI